MRWHHRADPENTEHLAAAMRQGTVKIAEGTRWPKNPITPGKPL